MKRAQQKSLFVSHRRSHQEFVPPPKGNPKAARPFSSRVPMHIVMRSSRAVRAHSLLRHQRAISALLASQAKRFYVQIKSTAICGNHIHCLLRAPSREALSNFLRAITGLIVRKVGWKINSGKNQDIASQRSVSVKPDAVEGERFWDARPYSRLVSTGKDEFTVRNYISINNLETEGYSRDAAREILRERHMPDRPSLLRSYVAEFI